MGRSASPELVSRSLNTEDAERPGCIPTQSVGTRLSAGLLNLTAMALKPQVVVLEPKFFDLCHQNKTLIFIDMCPFGNRA